MKVVVAGGRDFVPTMEDRMWLWEELTTLQCTEVVSGTARGADKFGEDVAKEMGLPVKRFPADWTTFGKGAGFKRNEEMANYADAVILFPGGNGTKHMKRMAETYKRTLIERR